MFNITFTLHVEYLTFNMRTWRVQWWTTVKPGEMFGVPTSLNVSLLDILKETSGQFPTVFVATKDRYFLQKAKPYAAVFAVTETLYFGQEVTVW